MGNQAAGGKANLLLVFFVSTFVIACLIATPAFSISFFVRPVVTQTFKAGWIFFESSHRADIDEFEAEPV